MSGKIILRLQAKLESKDDKIKQLVAKLEELAKAFKLEDEIDLFIHDTLNDSRES